MNNNVEKNLTEIDKAIQEMKEMQELIKVMEQEQQQSLAVMKVLMGKLNDCVSILEEHRKVGEEDE